MRPISLVIDGINSFYSRQVVDFRFDGLFCICGDTGSGKTTILDCIIIALYGSGKRTSLISDYINLRRDRAEIRLTFETEYEGVRCSYEVSRFLTSTSTKAKLVNLTTGETIAEQTEKVNAAIYKMIGLSREDFTQVVILEQGKFSKFLAANKKERNNTVGNLFKLNKYKDLGSRAHAFANRAKDALDETGKRLSELENTTLAAVNDKQKFIMGAKKRIEELKIKEDEVARKSAALAQNRQKYYECADAERQLCEVNASIDEVRPQLADATRFAEEKADMLAKAKAQKSEVMLTLARAGELKRLLGESEKRREAIERLRAEWRAANEEYERIKNQASQAAQKNAELRKKAEETEEELFSIVDLGEKAEYCDVFDIISAVRETDNSIKTTKSEYDRAAERAQRMRAKTLSDTENSSLAMKAVAKAVEKRDNIKKETSIYKAKVEEERRLKAARAIREELKEGDICPVCGSVISGNVEKVEETDSMTQLRNSEERLVQAENELQSAQNNAYSLATSLAESTKNSAEAAQAEGEWAKKLEDLMAQIKQPDKLGIMPSVAETLLDARTKQLKGENELKLLAQKEETARQKAEDVRLRGENESKELARLKGEIDESGISEEELSKASKRAQELETAIENLDTSCVKWGDKVKELSHRLSALDASAKLLALKAAQKPNFDPEEQKKCEQDAAAVAAEKETLIANAAKAESELDIMKKDLELKRELEKNKRELKEKYDLYYDIYRLVSGDKFIEYVAEEYIMQFTDSASETLGDITRGKYALVYKNGDFYVKDFLSGGLERKAGTLSGGETFLASLALAIAISREIARYKTYEFFFLDEGFGTLDSQSLDTVADALTALSDDTLIGVVTHRTELTDRIFDKITVMTSDGEGGSVIAQ